MMPAAEEWLMVYDLVLMHFTKVDGSWNILERTWNKIILEEIIDSPKTPLDQGYLTYKIWVVGREKAGTSIPRISIEAVTGPEP